MLKQKAWSTGQTDRCAKKGKAREKRSKPKKARGAHIIEMGADMRRHMCVWPLLLSLMAWSLVDGTEAAFCTTPVWQHRTLCCCPRNVL